MAKLRFVLVALVFFAPFIESEQLGSHDKPTVPASKPVSPRWKVAVLRHQFYRFFGDMALAASRAASRSAMAWRLS